MRKEPFPLTPERIQAQVLKFIIHETLEAVLATEAMSLD